jgi:transposase InsO family protein
MKNTTAILKEFCEGGRWERGHRIDHEELWSRQSFGRFGNAAAALREWERIYNERRFSMALNNRTPAEKLAAVLKAA